MEQLGSRITWIFMKFNIWWFFENIPRKFKFHEKLIRIAGALDEYPCTVTRISRWILLWMKNISDISCRENQNTFYVQYTFSGNLDVYGIMWGKKTWSYTATKCCVEKMRFACRITRARIQTPTHTSSCSSLRNWLIPFHIVKCFTVTLTKTEKLRNTLSKRIITICLAKL
jgi:hypothetical protein